MDIVCILERLCIIVEMRTILGKIWKLRHMREGDCDCALQFDLSPALLTQQQTTTQMCLTYGFGFS